MADEATHPLIESPVQQSPPDIVTCQPRATTGISPLSVIIKALLSQKESHGCYCLRCPKEESEQVASAMLIGTSNSPRQSSDSRHSDNNYCYISTLKQHLTELHVPVFSYEPNYHGSVNALYQKITKFFTKSDIHLFILYCSGPTNERGDLTITTTDDYGDELNEHLRLDTIAKKWKTAKADSDCYLLIIVDADGSGKWREKVEKHESEAKIIMMTSGGSSGNPDPQNLGQYTQSLIGSQGRGFFPGGVQEMIRKYLANDPSSTDGLVCYVYETFACYK